MSPSEAVAVKGKEMNPVSKELVQGRGTPLMKQQRRWLAGRAILALGILASMTLMGVQTGTHAATLHAKVFKVAVLSPGTSNDGSWGQDVNQGAVAARKYTTQLVFVDNLNTADQYQQQGAAFAAKKFNLIIVANYSVPDTVVKLARQFPNVKFVAMATHINGLPKNMAAVNLLFQNGDFLAGALAAMLAKGNTLGAIGGFSFPALNSEMEGFTLGARWIKHSMTVKETFINSWTDVAAARTAAQAQIGAGAELLFSATDQATQGIYAAAQSHPGTYVISQYFDTHTQAPKVALTSVLFNLHGAVQQIIQQSVNGSMRSKNYIYGPKKGVGKLSPFYGLANVIPASAHTRLMKIEAMLQSGKLRAPFLANTGDGAKYNLNKLPAPPK